MTLSGLSLTHITQLHNNNEVFTLFAHRTFSYTNHDFTFYCVNVHTYYIKHIYYG